MVRRVKRIPRLAGLTGLATGLAVLLAVALLLGVSDQGTQNCRQIELLKGELRTVIKRGDRTLERLTYYREHPSELALAHAQNAATLHTFRPRRCSRT